MRLWARCNTEIRRRKKKRQMDLKAKGKVERGRVESKAEGEEDDEFGEGDLQRK